MQLYIANSFYNLYHIYLLHIRLLFAMLFHELNQGYVVNRYGHIAYILKKMIYKMFEKE